MVRFFLPFGKNVGLYFILQYGIPLSIAQSATIGQTRQLYVCCQSHIDDGHHADAYLEQKPICIYRKKGIGENAFVWLFLQTSEYNRGSKQCQKS